MKTVTFGEIMLRLTPSGSDTLQQAGSFDAHFGGSEFNVAAGLVSLGGSSRFVTRLPDNPIGRRALSSIRAAGVETTDDIFTHDGRMGLYFLEPGSSPRPNRVVYDRGGASIAVTPETAYDWEKYFNSAGWFHVSGITPALGPGPYKATANAIRVAVVKNIPVSFDINFRVKLWSPDTCKTLLKPLLEKCRLIFSTEEDLDRVFGITEKSPEEIAMKAREYFGVEAVAITLRTTKTVKSNLWGGCCACPDGYYESRMYDVEVVDRVGAGDSFAAGFLAGFFKKNNYQHAVDIATAFSALKQTIPGDICTASLKETLELMEKGSAGRIQR